MRLDGARLAALVALLALWGVSLWNLGRWPPVHQDEPWILSPGYKLFTRGIYGSDLFTSFHGMERHYFEFMPLMSLLQGATTRVLGLGVWQMRFAPVALGTLTAALTFALARRLAGASVALVALLLLLTGPWTPGVGPLLSSGVPLVDVSRIARYDILTAPLGLCALWCFVRARESGRLSRDFLSGLLAGLAGLAHVYGLFWVGALLVALALDRFFSKQPVLPSAAAIVIGAAVAWSAWIGLILFNWDDFIGQLVPGRGRLDVLSPQFYLDNLLNEARRWFPAGRAATLAWPGLWWLVVALPLALIWLAARALRGRDRRAAWLLVPCLLIPLLFALFIQSKLPNYLISIVPLFAIAGAWTWVRLWASARPAVNVPVSPGSSQPAAWLTTEARRALSISQCPPRLRGFLSSALLHRRALAGLILAPVVLIGIAGIVRMQEIAGRLPTYEQFFADLRRAVPASARVIGLPLYWLALSDRDYRSFVLPFYLSDPDTTRQPVPFDVAMGVAAPHVVLMDEPMRQVFADRSTLFARLRADQFWAFMNRRGARVVRELRDRAGALLQVYQLDP